MENNSEYRDIKISMLQGRYKCTSAYSIPEDFEEWKECPICGLRPLIWEFNNGSTTACGCGQNEYRHFSICSESIMSYVTRNNGSAAGFDSDSLKKNWNHWVETGELLETYESLKSCGRW